MAGVSDWAEAGLLNWFFRAQTLSIPVTAYIRLYTANPNWETGVGGTLHTGGNYTNKTITMATYWQVSASGNGYRLTNTGTTGGDISWSCTDNWTAISGIGFWDATTAGNLLFGGAISVDPGSGDTVRIQSGAIDVDLDVTVKQGVSAYANQQMLLKLGGLTATQPSAQYLALYTVAPDVKSGGGTEVSTTGTNYTRKQLTAPATDWSAAVAGSTQYIRNVNQQTWSACGATGYTALAASVMDAASSGNMLASSGFTGVAITEGDQFYIAANNFTITMTD